MALIISGSTKCSICEKTLLENEEIVGWAAFLKQGHKFWEYSDSGMHKSCFENWEHKVEYQHLYNYQPIVDFDDPYIKKMIKQNGIPEWLKEIKAYREENEL